VAGAGWIAPGDSPGITTVTAVDPAAEGFTGFKFEFTGIGSPSYNSPTASTNDVLRIEDLTTPFISSLTSSNIVNIYFNAGSLSQGNVFRGGFYTDRQSDFWTSVKDGTFNYYVSDNSGTATNYNGQNYSLFSTLYPSLSVSSTAVFEASSFSGTSGWVTQFSITGGGAQPTSYTLSAGAGAATIIAGGTSTITGTATNTGTGSADSLAVSGLGITVSPSGSVSGFSPTSGTAANGGGFVAGSGIFTSTTAGNYSLVPTATGSNATAGGLATLTTTSTASVTVLDHAVGSLSGTGALLSGTISLGTWNWETSTWVAGTGSSPYALYNLATTSPELTAGLDVSGTSIGGDAGFSTNFDLAGYSLIAGGSSSSFLAMYDTTASGTVSGTYTATFTFVTRDQQNLSGANTTGNTLVLTAQVVVVPEPATIALAGLGAGLAGLLAYRRRKSQKRAA